MLCCIALRELKIRISVTRQCYRVNPSVKTTLLFNTLQSLITPASTLCIVLYFTRAFLLDDLNNLMQIILAFSDKKL